MTKAIETVRVFHRYYNLIQTSILSHILYSLNLQTSQSHQPEIHDGEKSRKKYLLDRRRHKLDEADPCNHCLLRVVSFHGLVLFALLHLGVQVTDEELKVNLFYSHN